MYQFMGFEYFTRQIYYEAINTRESVSGTDERNMSRRRGKLVPQIADETRLADINN